MMIMWNLRMKILIRFEGMIISGFVCLGVCSGMCGMEVEILNIFVFFSSYRDEVFVVKLVRFLVCEEVE